MEPKTSDGDLIRASVDDPGLFTAIFERHHQAIFDYLARRLGADTAGDLAADVFVVAFEKRHRFHTGVDDAAPWLYGIATNVARRYWRQQRRRSRAYRRAAAHLSWIDPTAQSDSRIDAQRLAATLEPALAKLRDRDREILFLYALTDLDYQQVAQAVGVPVGTVRSSLFGTRTRLRNSMAGIGQPPFEQPNRSPEE